MFERHKLVYAKNKTIMEMQKLGMITVENDLLMRQIAGNESNVRYGVGMLKTGTARCKYSCAAAVFVRIAAFYKAFPEEGEDKLSSEDWMKAAAFAMGLAGASHEEALAVIEELMQINKESFSNFDSIRQ